MAERTYVYCCFESDGGCGAELELLHGLLDTAKTQDCPECGRKMRRGINQDPRGSLRFLGVWYGNGNAKKSGY